MGDGGCLGGSGVGDVLAGGPDLFGGAEEFTCAAGLSGEDGFQGADNAGGDESGNDEGEDDDAQAEEQDDSTGIVGDLDRAAEFVVDVVHDIPCVGDGLAIPGGDLAQQFVVE